MEEKIIYIILTVLNCFLGSIAAYKLKTAGNKINSIFPLKKCINQILKSGLVLGAIIYFITALGSVFILRKLDVSLFFPLTSTTYIFSFIIANKFLGEKITKYKLIGICITIIGVILIV